MRAYVHMHICSKKFKVYEHIFPRFISLLRALAALSPNVRHLMRVHNSVIMEFSVQFLKEDTGEIISLTLNRQDYEKASKSKIYFMFVQYFV